MLKNLEERTRGIRRKIPTLRKEFLPPRTLKRRALKRRKRGGFPT
jgi:hypothetical protein